MADTKNDWIKNRLRENNYSKSEVYSMFPQFQSETDSYNWSEGSYTRCVRKCYSEIVADNEIDGGELEDEVIKLEANKQRVIDKNNYLRKVNRENYRQYNVLTESYNNYVDILSKIDLSKFKIVEHKTKEPIKIGICQLTDTHFNTLLNESESLGNSYNFDIASKRLKKFITETIKEFKLQNVTDCYLFMTGDMCSSSRRLQEVLSMNSSICMATIIATKLLMQAIIELNKYFNVKISFCVGNESRINQDLYSSNAILSSENVDYLIAQNLKLLFEGKKGVEFIDPKSLVKNFIEIPIDKDKTFNVVLTHGNQIKCEEKSYATIANQFLLNNKRVDLILCGHYHHVVNFEKLSFAGSMIGQTEYSCGLGFTTRASQSIYIINKDGTHWCKVIDLQNADKEYSNGYEFDSILEPYTYLVKNNNYNNKVTIENLV